MKRKGWVHGPPGGRFWERHGACGSGSKPETCSKPPGRSGIFCFFAPGLVGGHCIRVDPYYLTYKAEEVGYKPQVILGGRAINDGMGKYAGENVVKGLIRRGKTVKGSRVLILGLAFKENVSDVRNSKVRDVIDELREHGVEVVAHDPVVDPGQAEAEFELRPLPLEHVEKSGPHRGCRESSRFPYTDPGQAQ